mmetsp:Transcript_73133/g.237869  ORF Transcript_73133/g.237869 Transcript_73133/m.237869 type:complete len:187 (+) Transcript_73133:90-650(+)
MAPLPARRRRGARVLAALGATLLVTLLGEGARGTAFSGLRPSPASRLRVARRVQMDFGQFDFGHLALAEVDLSEKESVYLEFTKKIPLPLAAPGEFGFSALFGFVIPAVIGILVAYIAILLRPEAYLSDDQIATYRKLEVEMANQKAGKAEEAPVTRSGRRDAKRIASKRKLLGRKGKSDDDDDDE